MNLFKRVAVFGSNGYVGSLLVPKLLAEGYEVVAFDIQWFGDAFLPKDNENLSIIKGDIRDISAVKKALEGCDAMLMLSCLSNDVSCNLDLELSESINIHAFNPVVIAAKEMGINRFIYASSSSVYGISHAPDVTEEHPRLPVTLYNRSKMLCEDALLPHYSEDFTCAVVRPATVCGYAPRMRFDLTVNIMTLHALAKGQVTVFGGRQKRPNLHIEDMCDAYKLLLTAPKEKIAGQTFNVGKQNMTVMEIAQLIQKTLPQLDAAQPSITVEESQDNRSYHVNSDKIARVLGFTPKHSVEDAIRGIVIKWQSGMWRDALTNPIYTNVKQYVEAYGMGKR